MSALENQDDAREWEHTARRLEVAQRMADALRQINDWCSYATEEDTAARLMALQQIGVHARAALAEWETTR